jgi:hypothetical protein
LFFSYSISAFANFSRVLVAGFFVAMRFSCAGAGYGDPAGFGRSKAFNRG